MARNSVEHPGARSGAVSVSEMRMAAMLLCTSVAGGKPQSGGAGVVSQVSTGIVDWLFCPNRMQLQFKCLLTCSTRNSAVDGL